METIQAAPNGVSKSGIPSGCILMWFGSTATIPNGWHLCDGSNGTPDLRNRFIVGAGSSYSPGNTGGSDSVSLSTSQMPSHTHSGGSISFTIPTVIAGDETTDGCLYTQAAPNYRTPIEGSGSISIGYSGSGSSHENRPPYYALCFIMKL